MSSISQSEMERIFKVEGLNLGFPNNATTGHEVCDWKYWYDKNYEKSQMKKFEEIINSKYPQYILSNSIMGGCIHVERKSSGGFND